MFKKNDMRIISFILFLMCSITHLVSVYSRFNLAVFAAVVIAAAVCALAQKNAASEDAAADAAILYCFYVLEVLLAEWPAAGGYKPDTKFAVIVVGAGIAASFVSAVILSRIRLWLLVAGPALVFAAIMARFFRPVTVFVYLVFVLGLGVCYAASQWILRRRRFFVWLLFFADSVLYCYLEASGTDLPGKIYAKIFTEGLASALIYVTFALFVAAAAYFQISNRYSAMGSFAVWFAGLIFLLAKAHANYSGAGWIFLLLYFAAGIVCIGSMGSTGILVSIALAAGAQVMQACIAKGRPLTGLGMILALTAIALTARKVIYDRAPGTWLQKARPYIPAFVSILIFGGLSVYENSFSAAHMADVLIAGVAAAAALLGTMWYAEQNKVDTLKGRPFIILAIMLAILVMLGRNGVNQVTFTDEGESVTCEAACRDKKAAVEKLTVIHQKDMLGSMLRKDTRKTDAEETEKNADSFTVTKNYDFGLIRVSAENDAGVTSRAMYWYGTEP